jgi:acyl carrier protein
MEIDLDSSDNTLEIIKEAITRVTGRDLANQELDAPLELDSINRITLIVELEHAFQKPLDSEQVTPEAFNTLASMVELIQSLG